MEGQPTVSTLNHKKDTVASISIDFERDIERLAKLADSIRIIDEIQRLSQIINSPGVSPKSKTIINDIIEAQLNQLKAQLTNGKS